MFTDVSIRIYLLHCVCVSYYALRNIYITTVCFAASDAYNCSSGSSSSSRCIHKLVQKEKQRSVP